MPMHGVSRALGCNVGATEAEAAEISVEWRLLASGHYEIRDGRIRSKYLPNLIAGTVEDIELSKRCADVLSGRCDLGIESMVRIQSECSPPIYVMDGHNLAYFAWGEAQEMGFVERGAFVAHIDMHPDSSIAAPTTEVSTLASKAKRLKQLNIVNFIHAAFIDRMVDGIWFFYHSPDEAESPHDWEDGYILFIRDEPRYDNKNGYRVSLDLFIKNIPQPSTAILDVDLDAFIPYSEGVDYEKGKGCPEAARYIGQIARHFGVIDLATSPGFADQGEAIICAKQIVGEILKNSVCR